MASGKNSGLKEQVCVESPASAVLSLSAVTLPRWEESSLGSVGLQSVSGLTVTISLSDCPAIPLTIWQLGPFR